MRDGVQGAKTVYRDASGVKVDLKTKMMSEKEFEEYKSSVREARKNRLYVNWRNMNTGKDCRVIGPAS